MELLQCNHTLPTARLPATDFLMPEGGEPIVMGRWSFWGANVMGCAPGRPCSDEHDQQAWLQRARCATSHSCQ